MLKLLDSFFLVFHSLLVVFNLFGWMHPKTRRINLIALLLTGGSWVFLGIFYGLGYCPLTDWHFQVLREMGAVNLPSSYITYILMRWNGKLFSEPLIDRLTLWFYLAALTISVFVNIKYRKRKKVAAD
jgi:hypothetical protein